MRARSKLLLASFAPVILLAANARAQAADDEAKKLQHDAMSVDYLGADFAHAEEKLTRALSVCKKGGCSKTLRAELHRDLGMVELAGLDHADKGKAELGKAVALDPTIELDKVLTTPELAKAFDEAKKNPPASGDDDETEKPEAPKETVAPPPAAGDAIKNWFSISIQQDLALVLSNTDDVCTPNSQISGPYTCFRRPNSQYHGNPIGGLDDFVNTGLDAGPTRVLLGYDRVITGGLTAGARFGFAFRGGGPRADSGSGFLAFHGEARFAYWFGSDVFSTAGFRPFVFLSGGAAQVDTKFAVQVHEDPKLPQPVGQTNPKDQTLDAYRHMGQGFVGLGLGAMYAFVPRAGVFLDLRATEYFPQTGTVISPELGFAVGL